MENTNREPVVSVREFAEMYNISMPTAYALTDQPGFPLIRIGRKKLIRIRKVEQWFDEVTADGRSIL